MNIYVCSPYGGKEENYQAARGYCLTVAEAGHTPFASHVMLHKVFFEPNDREAGLEAGLALIDICQELWMFGPPPITRGMGIEIKYAKKKGLRIVNKMQKQPSQKTTPAKAATAPDPSFVNWAGQYLQARCDAMHRLSKQYSATEAGELLEIVKKDAIARSNKDGAAPLLDIYAGLAAITCKTAEAGLPFGLLKNNIATLDWRPQVEFATELLMGG
ncbi:MAG: hypothetical protein ACK5JF_02715 [Oscillospiraceae bacterium]